MNKTTKTIYGYYTTKNGHEGTHSFDVPQETTLEEAMKDFVDWLDIAVPNGYRAVSISDVSFEDAKEDVVDDIKTSALKKTLDDFDYMELANRIDKASEEFHEKFRKAFPLADEKTNPFWEAKNVKVKPAVKQEASKYHPDRSDWEAHLEAQKEPSKWPPEPVEKPKTIAEDLTEKYEARLIDRLSSNEKFHKILSKMVTAGVKAIIENPDNLAKVSPEAKLFVEGLKAARSVKSLIDECENVK